MNLDWEKRVPCRESGAVVCCFHIFWIGLGMPLSCFFLMRREYMIYKRENYYIYIYIFLNKRKNQIGTIWIVWLIWDQLNLGHG